MSVNIFDSLSSLQQRQSLLIVRFSHFFLVVYCVLLVSAETVVEDVREKDRSRSVDGGST